MSHQRVPGIPIHINGSIHLMAALSLQQYEDNRAAIVELLADAKKSDTLDSFTRGMPIALMAFQRNYPETTEADLEEWLDLTTFWKIITIALGRSQQELQPPAEYKDIYDAIAASQPKFMRAAKHRA